MKKNEIYRAAVSGFTSEGLGVCRVDGCAVFVPNAVPGEVYDLRITHVGKTAAHGKIETIIQRSPHRVNRRCPYAKQCGGCEFWHMDYETECAIKRQRVLDALNRLGGQNIENLTLTGAPSCEDYRNKAQFPVAPAKSGIEAGFFKKGTHELIPIDRCLIQPECADLAKQTVLQWARMYRVSAYDEESGRGLLRHIFVRHAAATGEILVCLVVNGEKLPHEKELIDLLCERIEGLRSVALNVNTRRGNAVLSEETRILWGADAIGDILCGLHFRISPRSFYQVNRTQAEVLYGKAIAAADLHGTETVLDLYCGTGTITLCLAGKAKNVIGVEVVDAAIEDAKRNAARNGIENARFFCADAGEAAQQLCDEGIRPDVIVVDPPRKGLSADVIDAIEKMSPDRVVYVSCDPATLARDVKLLCTKNYRLIHAEAVDLFPRCAHVETVVLLSQQRPNDKIRVELDLTEFDITAAEKEATYQEIKDYIFEKHGVKVSSLYIAQVKEKLGIKERENYNLPKNADSKQTQCPKEKEEMIVGALKHFKMI
ncbi:MAG: 23S rRNA (uracil(1939)-C(5))-methyltransferase RlmD [Clostridiales bacterium]|nr:23S rRNA (uracil(1939)-C(5))-methyltransferase RlmD [Clostridiales bacterium]